MADQETISASENSIVQRKYLLELLFLFLFVLVSCLQLNAHKH